MLPIFSTAAKRGFNKWLLLFSRDKKIVRPLLGPLHLECHSGAAMIRLVTDDHQPTEATMVQVGPGKEASPVALLPARGQATSVLLKLAPTVTYERWSAVVVEARKRGMEVWLQLPEGQ